MHIKSRNHTFHFRLTIPKDLRTNLGCREINRSLRTGDQATAKAMASLLSLRLRGLFDSTRNASKPPMNFHSVVDDHVRACFSLLEGQGLVFRPAQQEKHTAPSKAVTIQSLESPDTCGTLPENESEPSQYPQVTSYIPVASTPSVTLSEMISQYNAEHKEQWSVSTWNNYQGLAKVLGQLMGTGTQVTAIDRLSFKRYRDALCRLPKRFTSHPDFKEMSASKVLEMEKPKITITGKMANKYISYASGLFTWGKTMGYMAENPAEGMQVPTVDKETAMFEDADLKRIFSSPDYARGGSAEFWVPLLGLYTGARLNEICQLYVGDITKAEDDQGAFWWISINDEGDDKTVKTKNGRRIVPVHPTLVNLGFITYLKGLSPDGRVFPDLTFSKHRKNYSGHISKSFNRLLADLKVKPTQAQQARGIPNKTFHTFRHTAITAFLRTNVNTLMMAAVVGHDKKLGVTGNYFHGYEPRRLYDEVVALLDYDVDVLGLLGGHAFAKTCND